MKVIFKSDCWNDAVERVERTLLTALCDSPLNLVSVEKCTGLITWCTSGGCSCIRLCRLYRWELNIQTDLMISAYESSPLTAVLRRKGV